MATQPKKGTPVEATPWNLHNLAKKLKQEGETTEEVEGKILKVLKKCVPDCDSYFTKTQAECIATALGRTIFK